MNFSKAIEKFRKFTAVTKTKGTQEYYRFYLKALDENWGDQDCDSIDNDQIMDYILKRREMNPKISNASINKHIVTLKTVVKYATGREITFSKLKERNKIIPTVDDPTYHQIFSYYQKHLKNRYEFRNYVYLKLLLDTGLRLHELTHIKVKDIDFGSLCIHAKITKTNNDRYVCFTEPTASLLLKFIASQKVEGYLFKDYVTNEPLTTSSVECFISRLKKKLNIDESISPHKWRHTFATNYMIYGGDLENLRLLMGHSNLKTTQKYLHYSKNDIITRYQKVMKNECEGNETDEN
jgi:site-specific recombinase XerD